MKYAYLAVNILASVSIVVAAMNKSVDFYTLRAIVIAFCAYVIMIAVSTFIDIK